ncbi:TlpA family protein disulfide reductase [Amnibacterium endophyticum]|uniref:TlpA family protein disulfide reductase n=1 Tax=Amnibacterium endophyticum TaxID=2109337 RepID=A0ABW4LD59_9MICO
MRRALVPVLAAALLLTGCTEAGPNQDRLDINGVVTEWKHPDTPPVEFTGTTVEGKPFDLKDTRGSVTVVNFWYNACSPCRAEAPVLKDLAADFAKDGVRFVGVNTRDDRATAAGFERQFSPGYPSVVDQENGSAAQLAFAGVRGPNTTPTTLVLDREGRVTARYGSLANESVLRTLIQDAVDGTAA